MSRVAQYWLAPRALQIRYGPIGPTNLTGVYGGGKFSEATGRTESHSYVVIIIQFGGSSLREKKAHRRRGYPQEKCSITFPRTLRLDSEAFVCRRKWGSHLSSL
jgi:hypothetical protein